MGQRIYHDDRDHLWDARARVSRAKHHADALDAELGRFEGAMCESVTERDPDTGWQTFRVTVAEQPDWEWGFIVSDLVHHLRAALDNLVCGLVRLNGGSCGRHHQFPVATTCAEWRNAVGRNWLSGLRDDHIAEIQSVQPYRAEYDPTTHPLAVLDEMSRLDKHRVLTPVAFALSDQSPDISVAEGFEIVDLDWVPFTRLEAGAELIRVRVLPPDGPMWTCRTSRAST